jgi:hypothetical protein
MSGLARAFEDVLLGRARIKRLVAGPGNFAALHLRDMWRYQGAKLPERMLRGVARGARLTEEQAAG